MSETWEEMYRNWLLSNISDPDGELGNQLRSEPTELLERLYTGLYEENPREACVKELELMLPESFLKKIGRKT